MPWARSDRLAALVLVVVVAALVARPSSVRICLNGRLRARETRVDEPGAAVSGEPRPTGAADDVEGDAVPDLGSPPTAGGAALNRATPVPGNYRVGI